MRVSCPSCDATYEVPNAVLGGGGRRLRCAKCGHEWAPGRAALAPVPAPTVTESEPVPPSPTVAATTEQALTSRLIAPSPLVAVHEEPVAYGRATVAVAWAASILVLLGLTAAAYVFRDAVQETWPPSRLVYAALGLG